MRAGKGAALVLALTATVIVGTALSAHRRDEYLQAARLGLEPDRVDVALDLTPGIAVADAVIADIDRDRDRRLSADEKRAYVRQVLDATQLHVDGRALRLQPVASTFPDLDAFRRGEGTIQLQSAGVLPRLSDGRHQLQFRNTLSPGMSLYLANALVPATDRIAVTGQTRDASQRDLTIDFVVRAEAAPSVSPWLVGIMAGAACFAVFSMRPSRVKGDRMTRENER